MRSHAKASSAGSNSGKRAGLCSGLIALTLVAACLLPGIASAAQTRPLIESFGSDGTSGTSFNSTGPLAFDQASKDLFVLDQGAASIYGFDASTPATYTPLGGNFPLAAPNSEPFWLDDLAVDSSSHNLYYNSEGIPRLYGFDSSGAALGGSFPISIFGDPCGTAVDSSGNVWVADYNAMALQGYDSSGSSIGSISTAAVGNACRVAFDSEDNLYFALYEGATWKLTAASGYTEAAEIDSATSSALAVDQASDEVYVVHSGHISVYDSAGTFLYEFGSGVSGAQFKGIAVSAEDKVYVADANSGKVAVFGELAFPPDAQTEDATEVLTTTATLHGVVNPNGEQLTECTFEYGTTISYGQTAPCAPDAASIPADSADHAVSAELSGLTPGTMYHFRLAAANAGSGSIGGDRAFITGPPTVSAQSVETVGTSDVVLSAKINPKGAKTTYHVEYGTSASYGQSTPESEPIGFALDNSSHLVKVHISGLSAGTAYHFRFVATSAAGSTEGTDTTFATYPSSQPPTGACPNDRFRTGFGGRLPDCRAYEQATPVDKNGANIQGSIGLIQASRAGDRITFYLTGGLPTSGGSSRLAAYLASRGTSGWSANGLLAATEPSQEAFVWGWSDDLSSTVGTAPGPDGTGTAIYLRESDTAAFQEAFFKPGVIIPGQLGAVLLAGFAADTSHLIFEGDAALPAGAPGVTNLYDLDHGALTLVGRIPAGAATTCDDTSGPACVVASAGSFAGTNGNFAGYTPGAISRDGSRVFFRAHNTEQLYVREDGTRTTMASASQATAPDPNGQKPAAFMAATPDGSKVFFTSCEKLTDDSTAVSTAANTCDTPDQGKDLYSYDVASEELSDLTVDSNVSDPQRAGVQGVLGISDNGDYVYFVANGVLAPGASVGNCQENEGGSGSAKCNLYLYHDGEVTFIASLTGNQRETSDFLDWAQAAIERQKTSRVAADGSAVLFGAHLSLTGYPNAGTTQFYRYSAAEDELTCVSCNPNGLPPSSGATFGTGRNFLSDAPKFSPLTRNLAADGNRAFFETPDALLPIDTNGVKDVYEWEAKGSGSCESESQNGGCLYLLSSGASPDPSYFADASADGSHAFFFTSQQLVPSDRDELVDIYDAGMDAGLASQHTLASPTCAGTACQANPAPPPDPTMASAAFQGPGNAKKQTAARKCPKGKRKVRRAGKVRCQKAHKQHKRHSNRGGSK